MMKSNYCTRILLMFVAWSMFLLTSRTAIACGSGPLGPGGTHSAYLEYDRCSGTVTVKNIKIIQTNGGDNEDYAANITVSVWINDAWLPIWKAGARVVGLGFVPPAGWYFASGHSQVNIFAKDTNNASGISLATTSHNDGTTSWFLNLTWTKCFTGAINNGQIKVKVDHTYSYCAIPIGYDYTKTDSISTQEISPPISLTATQTECTKVNLLWQNSSQFWESSAACTTVKPYLTEVLRDDIVIASLAAGATSYTDNTAVHGVSYNYNIRKGYVIARDTSHIYSGKSNTAAGKLKDSPEQPSGFSATQDLCNGSIKLTWQWQGANPGNGFKIYRGTSAVNINEYVTTTAGSARSFTNDMTTPNVPVAKGVTYYYRIRAVDNCSRDGVYDDVMGFAPNIPLAPSNISITTDSILNRITVNWTDNANNETGYNIVRTIVGGGSTVFELNANTTQYIDNDAGACVSYLYTVKAINACSPNGVGTSAASSVALRPNLSNTFTATKLLTGSKGYYPDKVQLEWTNNNNSQLSQFRIYRKQAGSSADSTLITTQTSGSGIYTDLTASAGVLYKYTIIGEANCAGTTIYSNAISDIGFRSPYGLVNGKVTYAGGNAVKDVRVTASGTGSAVGSSLLFTGDASAATTPASTYLSFATGVTIELWAKRSNAVVALRRILSLKSGSNELINIYHQGANVHFDELVGGLPAGLTQSAAINGFSSNLSEYTQITCTMGATGLYIYINGVLKGSVIGNMSSNFPINNLSLELGRYFEGNIDELRIWNVYKDAATVSRDFNRFVSPNETGLVGYWNFDENIPGLFQFFDQSKTGNNYNATHAVMPTSVQWSNIIPSNSVLSNTSYTDANGNYTITNIRFINNGQTFTVTPNFSSANISHLFAPATKAIFLGEGSSVVNNIDFEDASSFLVSGRVIYAKGSNCPAEDIILKIDGNPVIQNGTFAKTASDGTFSIQVPIGPHVITVERADHVFSVGRFPATGSYDFIAPNSGLVFRDSTLVKVVGRVVGGARELNKVAGLGRSKNNIGVARFSFTSTGGCLTEQVTTDLQTGEYTAYLPPMNYNISTISISSDVTKNSYLSLNNPNTLSLSTIPQVITVVDTFRSTNLSRVDSVKYHTRLDFKYLVTPVVYVSNMNTHLDTLKNDFSGAQTIDINDSVSVNIANNALGYPVFIQNKYYEAKVKVYELYENKDVNAPIKIDNVPVAGTLQFTNDLATVGDVNKSVHINAGLFDYSFRAGDPNVLRNSITPSYSYTKTIQLTFIPDLGITVDWLPNQADLVTKFYRGIVFGSRSGGSNFTSSGPALVDFVLRDPPGSGSFSKWSSGRAFSKTESWKIGNDFGSEVKNTTHLGTKIVTFAGLGAGVITENETKMDITLGLTTESSINTEGELVTTLKSNTTLTTSSSSDGVGAGSDIYYGRSTNIIFGNSDVIELMDTATCRIVSAATGNQACFGSPVGGYQIGKQTGFFVVPGNVKTTFAYTQDEILTLIIPDLVGLRNQLFVKNSLNIRGQKKYQLKFNNSSDPDFIKKYGSNNDDPIWGTQRSTATPFIREKQDSIGESYSFRGNTPLETDSVRFYNDQIRLWKNAIARNEEQKYNAFRDSASTAAAGGRNVSIGQANYTQEFVSEVQQTYTESFEWNISEAISTDIGFEILSKGQDFSGSMTFKQTNGKSEKNDATITNSFEYTLHDGTAGDLISVDVIDPKSGDGHIFKLRAGRTSCPYEGKVMSLFFDPNNDTVTSSTLLDNGFEIQPATARNDVPDINVAQPNIFNVPAAEAAIFTLELGNISEGHADRTYDLRVNEATNPHGAIIKVDGLDPNRSFSVPYGTALQKTLTVERGPTQYDYNDIQLILKSNCDDGVLDTVRISVHFLPTCTDIKLLAPDDRWVLNNTFEDTLPVALGGYNYNFGGFNNMKYQYKAASSSQWLTLQYFDKDTSTVTRPGIKIPIPIGQPYANYNWVTKGIPDGNYELRAVTECIAPGYPNSSIYSPILQGVIDRVNPSPFGNPSPADGILEPNDEISIQFNELIDNSSLTLGNFDVRGVLNGSTLQTNASLHFDGDGDYVELPTGLNLINKPFTIEIVAKRGTLNQEQCLISQGVDAQQNIWFGFNAANKLIFKVGGEIVESQFAYLDQLSFTNYAISFDPASDRAYLYVNGVLANTGNTFLYSDYNGAGKMFIGKSSTGSETYYSGNLLELRVWSVNRTTAQIQANVKTTLTGRETGIMGNWHIDEAEGTQIRDLIRSRNGNIIGAVWQITPSGSSYEFNGSTGRLSVTSATTAITKEMDFTLEFWVKSIHIGTATLFSNGKGDSTDENPAITWSIDKTNSNSLVLRHLGQTYTLVDSGLFDGTWHHVAIVMQRVSNLTSYLDGNLQKTYLPSAFKELSGPRVSLAARMAISGVTVTYDQYFSGLLDEFRFWNISRTQEMIKRDKVNRLNGDEPGLSMYIPFELYALDATSVPILTASLNDIADTSHHSTSVGGAAFSSETPTIRLPRPVSGIKFNYAVNNDKIILTPTIDPAYIENVTLDITVKDVYDLRGNKMQSPKSWIAYVTKNQVKWQDQELSFTKQTLAPLTFTSVIVNSGGALKTFTLTNLPAWLTASPSSGTVSPNNTQKVTFTINPTVNIGSYEEAIGLLTDFGFPEKLVVKLKVFAPEPNWVIDESKFQNSMSIVGQLKIGNIFSSNPDNILAAFINDECRGKAKLQYFSAIDRYLVFLDVFGDTNNQQVKFKIWNAAEGKLHDDVTPELIFIANDLQGSVQVPVVFNADDKLIRTIGLNNGWNWLSFNLNMRDSNNLNNLFSKLKLDGGEMMRSQVMIADYSKSNGWLGSLASPTTGVKSNISYRFKSIGTDTLSISGNEINPSNTPVPIVIGWNWIGFISQRNMSTNEAFGNYVPRNGELIKGQTSFAIYDSILGWVGSLSTLRPNLGYMYQAKANGTLYYPRAGMFGKTSVEEDEERYLHWTANATLYQDNMNMIVRTVACSNLQQSGELLLGAYAGNELRGLTKARKYGNDWAYFLTVGGEIEGEPITFKLMNDATGKIYDCNETKLFVVNKLLGKTEQPITVTMAEGINCESLQAAMSNTFSCIVYPNPGSDARLVNMGINLLMDDIIEINIYDIEGRLVNNYSTGKLSAGYHVIPVFKSDIHSGIYFIKVKTSSEVVQSKFIKQ